MKRVLALLAPFLFFIVGLASLTLLLYETAIVNNQNNHYLRVLTCLTSIPPNVKTQATVDKCWTTVERADGIHAPRYDQSIVLERLR